MSPYNRERPWNPDAVEMEGDTAEWKSYEIERIVGHQIRRYGKTNVKEYRIRWLGYGEEFDEWRSPKREERYYGL